MNDRQLEQLLRMAREVEVLEQPEGRSGRWVGLGVAMAAAVVLGVFAVLALRGEPEVPRRIVKQTAPVEPAHPGGMVSMVVAMVTDPVTQCECVVLREASFGGRDIATVGRSELLQAVMPGMCADSRGDLLVVGLQGPRESLPSSKEAARALVSCLAPSTQGCGEAGSCYPGSALDCLPGSVSVVAETLALSR